MRATPIKEHSKAACTLELKKFLQVAPFLSDSIMLTCLALQNPPEIVCRLQYLILAASKWEYASP